MVKGESHYADSKGKDVRSTNIAAAKAVAAVVYTAIAPWLIL
jgi:hypothetical protein